MRQNQFFSQRVIHSLRIKHKFLRTGTHIQHASYAPLTVAKKLGDFFFSAYSCCAQLGSQFHTWAASNVY